MTLQVVLLFAITASFARANHCDITDTMENQWVNVESMKSDNDPRFLSELQVNNTEDCRQACCQKDLCSVMIYHATQNQSSTNCFLLNCSPDQKCVFEDKDGYVCYVIDKKHSTTSTTPRPSSLSSSTEKPEAVPSTTASSVAEPAATQNATTTTTTTTTVGTPLSSATNSSSATVLPSVPLASSSTLSTTNATASIATTTTTTTTSTTSAPTTTTRKTTATPTTTTAIPANLTSSDTTNNKASTNSSTPGTQTSKTLTTMLTTTTTTTATPTTSVILVSGQNASVSTVANETSTYVDSGSFQNDSISDNVNLESNATTSELLSKDEMGQLLNISQPLSKFDESSVENQIPDSLIQPFVSILSTSTASPNLNSSQSSTSSSSSSSSSSSVTTSSSSTTTTTELHFRNASTDLNKTTDRDVLSEDANKNVTKGRLDKLEEQTTLSPAIFGGLIALLCFGSFFVLAVLAIFGRKFFESWQRRHYSRIDYLVNGMYS